MQLLQTSFYLCHRIRMAEIILALVWLAGHSEVCLGENWLPNSQPPSSTEPCTDTNEPFGLSDTDVTTSGMARQGFVHVDRYEYARGLPNVVERLKDKCAILFAISESKTPDLKLLVVLDGCHWCRIQSLKVSYFGQEVFASDGAIIVENRASVLHLRLDRQIYTHHSALRSGADARDAIALELVARHTEAALMNDHEWPYGESCAIRKYSEVPRRKRAKDIKAPSETNYLWITEFRADFK